MQTKDLLAFRILLNSRSPRRKQILEQIGFETKVVHTQTNETFPATLRAEEIPVFLSEKKSLAYKERIGEKEILLSGDTMVFLDDEALGKPKDGADAFLMLKKLSGRKHSVVSGCTLRTEDKSVSFFEKTDVYFKHLSDEEINYYIQKYSPLDKAGAYGIQEWIGMTGIEKIDGDYYNVMGLPTASLFENLKKIIY
ncbi:MAG: septum formation protein Maf [Bacteroidales bacterium]|nr:septum formation protein Maf [Bacteroidales bacterium]